MLNVCTANVPSGGSAADQNKSRTDRGDVSLHSNQTVPRLPYRGPGALRLDSAVRSLVLVDHFGRSDTSPDVDLVPLAGIEPALLAELDFESSASTNSATGARLRGGRIIDKTRLRSTTAAARRVEKRNAGGAARGLSSGANHGGRPVREPI